MSSNSDSHAAFGYRIGDLANPFPTTMSSDEKKIGGEFGEVRSNIDVDSLTTYLLKNVQSLRRPIDVKQFKASQTGRS